MTAKPVAASVSDPFLSSSISHTQAEEIPSKTQVAELTKQVAELKLRTESLAQSLLHEQAKNRQLEADLEQISLDKRALVERNDELVRENVLAVKLRDVSESKLRTIQVEHEQLGQDFSSLNSSRTMEMEKFQQERAYWASERVDLVLKQALTNRDV